MPYQIASKSQKGRKKELHERNGDYCKSLIEKSYVVLALADGVGSCVNDSKASMTACELFIEKCQKALQDDKILTKEMLRSYCMEIDRVLAVDNLLTCFCAVAWNTNEEKAIWVHAGDTRIYKHGKALYGHGKENGLYQLTIDDKGKTINVKINGKYYADHGALVAATPINSALGDKNLYIHTGSVDFHHGESIILCSDGMYSSSSFAIDVESLLDKSNIEDDIAKIETTDDDDASLFVLRRDMVLDEKNDIQDVMQHFEQYCEKMPLKALIDLFSDELEKLIAGNGDVAQFAIVVSFMREKQLYPDKNRIDKILSAAVKWSKKMSAEGNENSILDRACFELRDILTYVFTH